MIEVRGKEMHIDGELAQREKTASAIKHSLGDLLPHDNVNHPAHYEAGQFECIDVMIEAIGREATVDFCLCNAFKYIYRCNKKHDSPIEDVKKAAWYLNKYIELEDKDGKQQGIYGEVRERGGGYQD